MALREAQRAVQQNGPMTLRALALLVLVAAWIGLVLLAIEAGRSGRDGNDLAWLWLALASIGAVATLAAAFVVGAGLFRREQRPQGGKHR